MSTVIINVKVANIRPKYHNLKEWMDDANNIYIGRKGIVFINGQRFPNENSIWHNPFKISQGMSRNEAIQKYKKYIIEKIKKENLFDELKKLKGKNLGCWCKPNSCHGDVLLELIQNI